MIKIGTLTCLHSNNVCARVGCLKAFQNRSDFFDGYSPDTLLGAMMTCNGWNRSLRITADREGLFQCCFACIRVLLND